MELLKHDGAWFRSDAGCKDFSALTSLEDRSVFLYSYLKTMAKPEFDQGRILFKAAFFLADGVMGSSLPYQAYPDVINPEKNPFVAYLAKADLFPGESTFYYIFLGILHGIANPMQAKDWVYERNLEDPDYLREKLEQLGKNLYPSPTLMADPDAYAIDSSLEAVQLKLIWLFGQS